MRLLATSLLLLAGLAGASAALAMDFTHKAPVVGKSVPAFKVSAAYACDNRNLNNAYFQDTNGGYGNDFNFGASSRLSAVTFTHYGFGFPGPYTYDIELWDKASCTKIMSVDNLFAVDAANQPQVELVDLCLQNIYVTGDVIVAIDPNSCLAPNDCYPDVMFDDQVNVFCPFIIDLGAGQCFDVSAQSGPFLLRAETNNCPTPVKSGSWGAVKQIYR